MSLSTRLGWRAAADQVHRAGRVMGCTAWAGVRRRSVETRALEALQFGARQGFLIVHRRQRRRQSLRQHRRVAGRPGSRLRPAAPAPAPPGWPPARRSRARAPRTGRSLPASGSSPANLKASRLSCRSVRVAARTLRPNRQAEVAAHLGQVGRRKIHGGALVVRELALALRRRRARSRESVTLVGPGPPATSSASRRPDAPRPAPRGPRCRRSPGPVLHVPSDGRTLRAGAASPAPLWCAHLWGPDGRSCIALGAVHAPKWGAGMRPDRGTEAATSSATVSNPPGEPA